MSRDIITYWGKVDGKFFQMYKGKQDRVVHIKLNGNERILCLPIDEELECYLSLGKEVAVVISDSG